MYEAFYGLRERPFALTPNPRFLLLTPGHRRALVSIELGIAGRKGIVSLIGEAGTGKTTVARALMAKPGSRTIYVYLNQSLVSAADLRQCLTRSFDLAPAAETSNTELIFALTRRLSTTHQQDRSVALIVDEAQALSDELLEEVRLLSNIETLDGKLLTLVLIGQPQLASRLNEDRWQHLKQRIEIRSVLAPLDLPQTAAYIWSRVSTAGGDASQMFSADAVRLIHERSRGIPRSISVITENALMAGFAEQERPVTRRLVVRVCEELDMPEIAADGASPAPPPSILQIPVARAATNGAAVESRQPRSRPSDRRRPAPPEARRGWWPWLLARLRA
jgi:general secretion pathway protein A